MVSILELSPMQQKGGNCKEGLQTVQAQNFGIH